MAGLYIHIPFCRSKCFYCDFFSKGEGGETDAYVDALLAEWRLRKVELDEEVKTIYLGGGTPSLMSDKQLHRLIAGIGSYVEINRLQEFHHRSKSGRYQHWENQYMERVGYKPDKHRDTIVQRQGTVGNRQAA